MKTFDSCKTKFKIAILLSGGVDSLVAAHLLKHQGHDVVGIHFVTGYEKSNPEQDLAHTFGVDPQSNVTTSRTVTALANQLDIPIEIMNCSREFKSQVVDYFIRTYAAGKTPNPCLVCNPTIKFGAAFTFARTLGAEKLATGHYARTRFDQHGICCLLRGKDRAKDQSYFLARLSQDKLSNAIFPLGDMTKQETVQLAQQSNLKPISPQESQDVCFIHDNRYSEFLTQQPGFHTKPGPIKDLAGNIIGQHPGLHNFTVGQRRGINCPAQKPYYVINMDPKNNCLTVGFKQDTLAEECKVDNINWIGEVPGMPVDVKTRVRYRHEAASSHLIPIGEGQAQVYFQSPQSAITPGQGAVFYSGEEVLGGGFITEAR